MSLKEFSLPVYCLDGENVLDHLGEVVAMDVALETDYAATIVELLRCRPIGKSMTPNEWQASNRALQLLGERITNVPPLLSRALLSRHSAGLHSCMA